MQTGSASDTVVYEQADHIPHYGACHFITLLAAQPGQAVVRRESHVFLSEPECHLHEITYAHHADQDPAFLERDARRATHELFAAHRAQDTTPLDAAGTPRPAPAASLLYRITPSSEPPFARFRQEQRFTHVLAELPDRTASATLRTAVLQALFPPAPAAAYSRGQHGPAGPRF